MSCVTLCSSLVKSIILKRWFWPPSLLPTTTCIAKIFLGYTNIHRSSTWLDNNFYNFPNKGREKKKRWNNMILGELLAPIRKWGLTGDELWTKQLAKSWWIWQGVVEMVACGWRGVPGDQHDLEKDYCCSSREGG